MSTNMDAIIFFYYASLFAEWVAVILAFLKYREGDISSAIFFVLVSIALMLERQLKR